MLFTIGMTKKMDGPVSLCGFAVLLLIMGTNGQTATILTNASPAAAGTDVTLTCNVADGTPNAISWQDISIIDSPEIIFSGMTRFSTDEKFDNFNVTSLTATQSVMTIFNAEATNDDGIYRCDISTGTDDTVNFQVEAAPTVSLSVISTLVNNEDMYVATCDAVGSKPQVTISWTLDGVAQTDGNGNTIVETNPAASPPLSNTKSVFTFPATQENYGQTLVCLTTGNQLTELNRQESRDMNIHTSPSTAGTTVTADYVTDGTDIRVICTAKNEPTPTMRNYYTFSNGTLIHESMVSVTKVTVPNPVVGTEYTCMAGNYLGNTSLSAAVVYDPTRPTTSPTPTAPITTEGVTTTTAPDTTEPFVVGPSSPPGTAPDTTEPFVVGPSSPPGTAPDTTEPVVVGPTTNPTGTGSTLSPHMIGIAVLVILLVASITINIVLVIILKRKTLPEFDESKKNDKRNKINTQQEVNDNVAYEMIHSENRAYTALKLDSSHSFVIARENVTFFTRLGSIGRGDFGEVWKGDLRSNQNHLDVAIRQIPDRVTKSLHVLQAIKVLYNLSDQPNIVRCLGYCKEQGSILYEFITGGTLLTHLQTSGVQSQPTYSNLKPNGVRIEEGTLLNLAWQVAKGMQFLASKKIIHGALCAHNVLLGERKQCKISDYGLSTPFFGDVAKPTRWSSPETMATGDQTTEGDVWSFGIVLWEIVTLGARPYPNMTVSSVQTEVANGYQMPRPRHCAQEVYVVMTGCWEKEPENRSTFDHILKSMERILEKTHSYLSLNDLDEGLYASTLDM